MNRDQAVHQLSNRNNHLIREISCGKLKDNNELTNSIPKYSKFNNLDLVPVYRRLDQSEPSLYQIISLNLLLN